MHIHYKNLEWRRKTQHEPNDIYRGHKLSFSVSNLIYSCRHPKSKKKLGPYLIKSNKSIKTAYFTERRDRINQ